MGEGIELFCQNVRGRKLACSSIVPRPMKTPFNSLCKNNFTKENEREVSFKLAQYESCTKLHPQRDSSTEKFSKGRGTFRPIARQRRPTERGRNSFQAGDILLGGRYLNCVETMHVAGQTFSRGSPSDTGLGTSIPFDPSRQDGVQNNV